MEPTARPPATGAGPLNARLFIAKTLELVGMFTVGSAFVYGVFGNNMGMEFLYLGIGSAVFCVGYLLEGRRAGNT